MTPGVFVAIVGPSGAGKDTLIREARRRLRDDPAFHFVRRLVTRPSDAHEDHQTLDEAEFRDGIASGRFALFWRAHELGYAVPSSICARIEAGTTCVCNVSRGAIADMRRVFPRQSIVLITAPPEMLFDRLAARGRENLPQIERRLAREAALAGIDPDCTVANDGTAAEGGEKLVRVLREISDGRLAISHAGACPRSG